MRFELRRPVSHRTDAKTDPRTQLTGSPIGRRQAWTAFRAAASRQNGPPVQYQRQRQLSQLQQDIWSSWRWFLHRPHRLTGHSLKWFHGVFDPSPGTPACAPPGWHPRQSGRVRRNRPRSIPRPCNKGEQCGSMSTPAPRSQGTKAPVKTLEVRDRRSPLTTWRISRIAKGSY